MVCCYSSVQALDTGMDKDGYRTPLFSRWRARTHESFVSSQIAIRDGLFVSSEFLQVVVQIYSRCASTIIQGTCMCCLTSPQNGVRYVQQQRDTIPERNARKAWHLHLYGTGALTFPSWVVYHATPARNKIPDYIRNLSSQKNVWVESKEYGQGQTKRTMYNYLIIYSIIIIYDFPTKYQVGSIIYNGNFKFLYNTRKLKKMVRA